MDWTRFNVSTIWRIGPTNVVGILMGYHGTGHILCNLWNGDGRLRLLLFNETGEIFYAQSKPAAHASIIELDQMLSNTITYYSN